MYVLPSKISKKCDLCDVKVCSMQVFWATLCVHRIGDESLTSSGLNLIYMLISSEGLSRSITFFKEKSVSKEKKNNLHQKQHGMVYCMSE